MLPCVCSVTDHKRRQNVVRTSVTHSAITLCATFLFLPHFDVVCDLLLNRRTTAWNLFVNLIHYVYFFFFTFFHVVSSLSQDSLIQSSSVLSPFDPFLAIDRSYTSCFRSNKVRNTKLQTPETKRTRGTFGLRDQRSYDSRLKHNIRGSNMNTNGWIIAWTIWWERICFSLQALWLLPLCHCASSLLQ